jgi:hypothetical protein
MIAADSDAQVEDGVLIAHARQRRRIARQPPPARG